MRGYRTSVPLACHGRNHNTGGGRYAIGGDSIGLGGIEEGHVSNVEHAPAKDPRVERTVPNSGARFPEPS